MKNIYFIQPSSYYGGEICLPYASGALAAYAWSIDKIKDNYILADIIYRKDSKEACSEKISEPFLIAFSCYIWNFEHNKLIAKHLKEKFPDAYILFGGHNISNTSSELLEECSYIDFLIHEEGEIPFAELLLALINEKNLSDVPNLSYRINNKIIKTENQFYDVKKFPSPYTSGIFDKIMENSDDVFYGIIETNRGCPYKCVYCDWGRQAKNIRLFPMEKVKKDIEWLSEHKIGYCICADANFGILERDVIISEWLVDSKKKTGYPSKIQFCFTKNSDERVFEINKKMNECGLSKGATISLQTLSEKTLNDICRTNMTFSHYTDLVRKYNEAGIFTYTDMILGLPGETFESFTNGIGKLFEAGQHSSVNIFNCEMLINARLSQKEMVNEHNIKFAKCSLNRHHTELGIETEENNSVVISTKDMNEKEWIDANIFVAVTGAFHNLGLLQCFAIYLFNELGVGYTEFYLSLLDHFKNNPQSVAGKIYYSLYRMLSDVTENLGSCETLLPEFGNVNWPVEEWFFLQTVKKFDTFFIEIKDFLKSFGISSEIFENLLVYQQKMIKRPFISKFSFNISYDFPQYFNNIYNGKHLPLEKKSLTINVNNFNAKNNYPDYARETVWYGRKGGRIMYKEEMEIIVNTTE
ncbi:MAG: radical SAM protein [Clostridia bacterium]|nr:radical SAM protein [Clostridia bacterium]